MSSPKNNTSAQKRLSGAEVAGMVGFWVVIASLTLLRRGTDFRGQDGLTNSEILLTAIEYGLWILVTPLAFYLLARFAIQRENWQKRVLLHIVIAFVIACVIDMIHSHAISELFFENRPRGRSRMRPPFPENALRSVTGFRFIDELVVYGAIVASALARQYFLKYRERQAQALELEAQLTDAKLDALRMQLNPHFLFNTLHAVSALVERDPSGVRRMIARLSDLLRHSLDGDAQEVTLRDELQVLNSYLDIQQVRFQDTLEIDIDVPLNLLDALVPNLVLQPLAENAIEHGISRLVDVPGRLLISAERADDLLHIDVIDNGIGLSPTDGAGGGVGLSNTRARLAGLYGDKGTCSLSQPGTGGCIARITLPYHTSAAQSNSARSDD